MFPLSAGLSISDPAIKVETTHRLKIVFVPCICTPYIWPQDCKNIKWAGIITTWYNKHVQKLLFLVGVMEEERRGTFKRAESFVVKIGSPTDSTLPFSDLGQCQHNKSHDSSIVILYIIFSCSITKSNTKLCSRRLRQDN